MPRPNSSLPLGYAKREDSLTGYDYYVNMVEGTSQWTMPRISAYAASQMSQSLNTMTRSLVDPDTVPPPHGYHNYAAQSVCTDYHGLQQAPYYQQPPEQQAYHYHQQQQQHMLASQQLTQRQNEMGPQRPRQDSHDPVQPPRRSQTHLNSTPQHHPSSRPAHNPHPHSSNTYPRPSIPRAEGRRRSHSSRKNRQRTDSHSSGYQALTGILAGSLAAFGLHRYMEDFDEADEFGYDFDHEYVQAPGWHNQYPQ
ncbi:hypothetical protein IWW54_002277 [Coemansia sp. RSA 2705]|nr:hypothetical protein IWW54_002277 [Coemansia sp. RSA 2705]